jgi:hypothetical protein
VKAPEENFVKDNAHTLSVITTRAVENAPSSIRTISRVTRTFNFLAAQVTTQTYDAALQSGGYQSGGVAAMSTTTLQQQFDDFASDREIRFMHNKLVEMGGTPPAIDDLLGGLGKKTGLTSMKNGG